jgi:hypothetical protein
VRGQKIKIMGQFTFLFIDGKNIKQEVWIQASSWKVAQKRFEAKYQNVKEIIKAKRQS